MKHLILSAEETFSTKIVDEPEELGEKDEERIDNTHETILDEKRSVEKYLVNRMETEKKEIEEICESTTTIVEYMDHEKSQTEPGESVKPAWK